LTASTGFQESQRMKGNTAEFFLENSRQLKKKGGERIWFITERIIKQFTTSTPTKSSLQSKKDKSVLEPGRLNTGLGGLA